MEDLTGIMEVEGELAGTMVEEDLLAGIIVEEVELPLTRIMVFLAVITMEEVEDCK